MTLIIHDIAEFLSPLGILLIGVAVMVSVAVPSIKQAFFPSKKQLEKTFNEPIEEIPPEIIGARVTDKRTAVASTGSVKSPNHEIVFFVSFLTDDGETREYRVTQEIFEKCEIYQTGDLVTYDGIFFDFGEGEEIKE